MNNIIEELLEERLLMRLRAQELAMRLYAHLP